MSDPPEQWPGSRSRQRAAAPVCVKLTPPRLERIITNSRSGGARVRRRDRNRAPPIGGERRRHLRTEPATTTPEGLDNWNIRRIDRLDARLAGECLFDERRQFRLLLFLAHGIAGLELRQQ